jgi:hypothetical protein
MELRTVTRGPIMLRKPIILFSITAPSPIWQPSAMKLDRIVALSI